MVGYSDSGKDTGTSAPSGRSTTRRSNWPRRRARPASRSSSSTAAAARPRAAAGAPTGRSWPSPRARSRAGSGSPSRARRCPRGTPIWSWPSGRWSRRCRPCCSPARCRTRRSGTSGARRWCGCPTCRAGATGRSSTTTPSSCASSARWHRSPSCRELNIGSRPPSRRASRDVESLRAIPWVFAWTQNRLLLPSWYGAGTALCAGDVELQREMWRDWPFFRGLIGTLEMALFKTDLGVAERYLSLVDEDIAERFWTDLRDEYDSVVGRVLDSHRAGPAAGRDAGAAARGSSTATRGSIPCRTCRSSCCGGCGRGARRRALRCSPRSPASRPACAIPVRGAAIAAITRVASVSIGIDPPRELLGGTSDHVRARPGVAVNANVVH